MSEDLLAMLDDRRAKYASEWTQGNAPHFEAAGDYRWMADFIGGHPYVLDIGMGDGRAIVELLRQGHDVISIDENIACVMIAGDRLKTAGYTAHVIEREITRHQFEDGYEVRYADICQARRPPGGEVVLVEGDILTDAGLVDALRTIAPFDAVSCWMIGTHEAVHDNRLLKNIETNQSSYRRFVHMKVCEVADSVLRSGGLLHIVDRGIDSAEQHEDDLRHDYALIASHTLLVLEATHFRRYVESEQGIEMRVGAGRGQEVESRSRTLMSVLFRKP